VKRSVGKKNQNAAPAPGDAVAGGTSTRGGSRGRWLGAAAMVAVVFVVAGLIGEVVRDHKAKQLTPPTSAGGPSSFAVPVNGHASVTLTVYEDMRDPATVAFQQTYGETLAQLIASGTVDVLYREVAGVDKAQGGTGSLNAGNALACSQDTGNTYFTAYRKVLLDHQPAEGTDTYGSKAKLITLSKKVKKLDTDVFRACVDSGAHDVWVQDSTSDFTTANLGTVPVLTMKLVDEDQDTTQTLIGGSATISPKKLFSKVIDAAKTAPTASPSASASAN
jgi:protein-disulfide isomerase